MSNTYDERCPRCDFDFDAIKEKDNECPNCSLPYEWYVLHIQEEEGVNVYFDMIKWLY